jgi:Flp pilus assembly CpaE family ATPase
VLLAADDLHRLGAGALAELGRVGQPLVLLARGGDDESASAVLPLDADGPAVCAALRAAARGERSFPRPRRPERTESPPPEPAPAEGSAAVLVVVGGHGGPGRTTVALGLAAALGAVAPAALVEADLDAPAAAAYLNLDPSRNLCMLAHAEPGSPAAWRREVAREAQPLADASPHGVVLCGPPKRAMRPLVTPGLLERLVAELRRTQRYIVLDVGADLAGPEAATHRAALALADRVLVVAVADLLGLARAQATLALLGAFGVDQEKVALVLNRHDRRAHWGRSEVERHLGRPVAAVVPCDHARAARAARAQRPLVLDRRSRAARALLDLAGRVHGGRVLLPPEPRPPGRWAALVRAAGLPAAWAARLRRRRAASEESAAGGSDGGRVRALP